MKIIRWTQARKAKLAQDILMDRIPLEKAYADFALSPEELRDWCMRLQIKQPLKATLRGPVSA